MTSLMSSDAHYPRCPRVSGLLPHPDAVWRLCPQLPGHAAPALQVTSHDDGWCHKHHDVLRLVDILGIHMGLVTDSVTETLPSPTPVPEEDLETIIAPVILSGSLDILTDEHYDSQVEGDKVVKFDEKDSPSIPAAEETVGEVNMMI